MKRTSHAPKPRSQPLSAAAMLAVAACIGPQPHENELPSARSHSLATDPPSLFGEPTKCLNTRDPGAAAEVAEEIARHREKRYPYDPRDGVRSVQHYGFASVCYERAGRPHDAARTHRSRRHLVTRVVADYAGARLRLARAIDEERWEAAHRTVRHLQRMTEHLGEHQYVEWLEQVGAKAYSEVSDSS